MHNPFVEIATGHNVKSGTVPASIQRPVVPLATEYIRASRSLAGPPVSQATHDRARLIAMVVALDRRGDATRRIDTLLGVSTREEGRYVKPVVLAETHAPASREEPDAVLRHTRRCHRRWSDHRDRGSDGSARSHVPAMDTAARERTAPDLAGQCAPV